MLPAPRTRGSGEVLPHAATPSHHGHPLDDANALAAAYRFLRTTEHRLQQVADRQTHQLPGGEAEQARLAFGMGYASYAAFVSALAQHRDNVAHCFRELLAPQQPADRRQPTDLAMAAASWGEAAAFGRELESL